MQVVDAADGAKAADDQWPAFHKSTVHASPVMFDFDFDGVLDILVATYDGEILVIKDTVLPAAPGAGLRQAVKSLRCTVWQHSSPLRQHNKLCLSLGRPCRWLQWQSLQSADRLLLQ